MARSEAQKRADKKSREKIYDSITFISRKDSRLKDMLNYAAHKTVKSKNQYITDALDAQFTRDGITIDMLPPSGATIPRETPGRKRVLREIMVYEVCVADKTSDAWEETVFVTADLEKAREKLAITVRKTRGVENTLPYIRGWKFEAYTKKEAVDKCKDMLITVDAEMTDDGEVLWVERNLREPDYIEGLDE